MNKEIIDKLFDVNNMLTELEVLIDIAVKYCEISDEDYSKMSVMLAVMQDKLRLLQALEDSIFSFCRSESYSPK